MNAKTSWSCTKEEGRSEVEARTSEEKSVVRITCRMLLRLEQCVEVPEAAQPRTHMGYEQRPVKRIRRGDKGLKDLHSQLVFDSVLLPVQLLPTYHCKVHASFNHQR